MLYDGGERLAYWCGTHNVVRIMAVGLRPTIVARSRCVSRGKVVTIVRSYSSGVHGEPEIQDGEREV